MTRSRSRLTCESRATGAGRISAATGSAGGGVMQSSRGVFLALAPDAGEIGDGRTGVEVVQRVVGAARALRGGFAHLGLLVLQVSEVDRAGRAGLLAGRLHRAVGGNRLALGLRQHATGLDALDAEGALLHHALRAHRDVRVQHERHRLRPGLDLVVEPVEAPDLVGAVVRAVARADAAVVDHAVQAGRRVVRREHGADRLAGRRAALLAEHRRVAHVGVAELLGVLRPGATRQQGLLAGTDVALDAQPRHLARAHHLALADDRDVVLDGAGDDAGAAARAAVDVD